MGMEEVPTLKKVKSTTELLRLARSFATYRQTYGHLVIGFMPKKIELDKISNGI